MGTTNLGALVLDDGGIPAVSQTPVRGIRRYSLSLTPVSVAAATVAEQTFTVTGLTVGDDVFVNNPATATAVGIVGARVSAADTLALRYVNPTAGALVPTAGVHDIIAFRF